MTCLEDSGKVNTGRGSSLTNVLLNCIVYIKELRVECDSMFIRGSDGAIGSIIAAPDNIHPSAVAASLLRESGEGLENDQIIRPCLLVGNAATQYSKQHGLFNPGKVCGIASSIVMSRFLKSEFSRVRNTKQF